MRRARRQRRFGHAGGRARQGAIALGAFAIAALLGGLGASPVRAQLLHLDEMLWTAPLDSLAGPSLTLAIDRFEEPEFGWSADRVLATLRLPLGPDHGVFVRLPHATFDFADTPLFSRWPWLEGEQELTALDIERRVSSFGQIEVGGDRRAGLPMLGRIAFGGTVGLPVGTDRLYPISSVSIPVRAEFRKRLEPFPSARLDLQAGALYNIDSGGDRLDAAAFPGGWHAAAALELGPTVGRRLNLEYDHQDRDGRISQRLGAALVLPWTERGSWRFRVDRELAGTVDRFAAWRFGVAWRFAYRKPEPPGSSETPGPSETSETPESSAAPAEEGDPQPLPADEPGHP